MRIAKLLPFATLLLGLLPVTAQTYVPKQIRIQGAPAADQPDILRILDLKPNTPLNKTQVEAALQRLADTGTFSDLSYSIDANTLTIILKGSPESQELPARFGNFVWWKSGELEPLVEARVPLFHGKLPLTGQLTDQVSAALVALLAEKGITGAKVTAHTSTLGTGGTQINAIVLSITRPPVVLGNLKLLGAVAGVRQQLDVIGSKLAGQEFDSLETTATIRNNVADAHRDAGYLDVTVDEPEFSAPREAMLTYEVDADATVHPGEQFHITQLDLDPPPPVTIAEARRVTGLHVGDPAGAMALKIAQGTLQRAYEAHGYMEAHVQGISTPNLAAHGVVYHFSISPGELDHLGGIDTSSLPKDLEQQFLHEWHGTVGMPADIAFNAEVSRTLSAIGATKSVRLRMRIDRNKHAILLMLVPVSSDTP